MQLAPHGIHEIQIARPVAEKSGPGATKYYDLTQGQSACDLTCLTYTETGQHLGKTRHFDLTRGDAKVRSSSQDSISTGYSFESCCECASEDLTESADATDSGSDSAGSLDGSSRGRGRNAIGSSRPSPESLQHSPEPRESRCRKLYGGGIHLGPRSSPRPCAEGHRGTSSTAEAPQAPRHLEQHNDSRRLVQLGPKPRRALSPSEAEGGVVALGIWKLEGQAVDRQSARAVTPAPVQDEWGLPSDLQSWVAQNCSDASLSIQAQHLKDNLHKHVNARSVDRFVFKLTNKLEKLDVAGLFSDCF